MERIFLCGCGGVAGFLAPSLSYYSVLAADGDCFEDSNQTRQPLARKYPNQKKALAFHEEYGFDPFDEYVTQENIREILEWEPDFVISAVDNDDARHVLWETFNGNTPILWGSNEVWSPQAGLSLPEASWIPWEWLPKRPIEEQATQCGSQTARANAAAASLAVTLMNMYLDDPTNPDNPIFMAHEHGSPLISLSRQEVLS